MSIENSRETRRHICVQPQGALLLSDRLTELAGQPIESPHHIYGIDFSGANEISDDAIKARREATTLDRVHASMLLQTSGRANALRALLKGEMDRGPDFLRLANALSALYPQWSEEKRLVDAMLLAVPR